MCTSQISVSHPEKREAIEKNGWQIAPADLLATDAAMLRFVVQENGHWLEAVVFCLDNSATTSISTSTSGEGNPVTMVVLAG